MKKAWICMLACIVLMTGVGYFAVGNPAIFFRNQRLKRAITALDDGGMVSLNEVIPFAWDALYMPEPYQSKAEIEEMIGFKSADIQENDINEGMVHLLFVEEKKVGAGVLGYRSNLGYSIDFSSKEGQNVTYAEDAQFLVTKVGKDTVLVFDSREQ